MIASDGSPAIANEKEQSRKRQQPEVVYFYISQHPIVFSARVSPLFFVYFLFVAAKHNSSLDSRPTTVTFPHIVFLLKSRLITVVSVRSCVCGIASEESFQQTAGVWCRVFVFGFCCYSIG